jgi:hypothetical protein
LDCGPDANRPAPVRQGLERHFDRSCLYVPTGRVCMPRIDANDRKLDPTKLVPKPARHRACLKVNALRQWSMFTKLVAQSAGIRLLPRRSIARSRSPRTPRYLFCETSSPTYCLMTAPPNHLIARARRRMTGADALFDCRLAARQDALTDHSDRGSQHASEQFQRLMADSGILGASVDPGKVWGQRGNGEIALDAEDRAHRAQNLSH